MTFPARILATLALCLVCYLAGMATWAHVAGGGPQADALPAEPDTVYVSATTPDRPDAPSLPSLVYEFAPLPVADVDTVYVTVPASLSGPPRIAGPAPLDVTRDRCTATLWDPAAGAWTQEVYAVPQPRVTLSALASAAYAFPVADAAAYLALPVSVRLTGRASLTLSPMYYAAPGSYGPALSASLRYRLLSL